MSHNYHFQSKSTKYYVISMKSDKAGDVVRTANGGTSVPPNSVRGPHCQMSASASFSSSKLTFFLGQVLTVNPTPLPGIVTITGVTGLYVSLNVSLHLYILQVLGDLVLQKSGLGKCRGHQAHLVQ